MNLSAELIEKAKVAKTAEELITMAKALNIELTSDAANEYFTMLHQKSGEVSDEELDNVAGGVCYVDDGRPVVTSGCNCKFVRCCHCGHVGSEGTWVYDHGECCSECGLILSCGNCSYCKYDREKLLLLCNEPHNRRR